MTVAAIAFVPGSPLAIPAVSHAQYVDHRDEVTSLQQATAAAVDACLTDADVVLVLATGDRDAVVDGRHVDLVGLGVPGVEADLPGHPLAHALADALDLPVTSGPAGVEADVLGLLAHAHGLPVVTVEVTGETPTGQVLADALALRPERVAVLVAADLSCTRDTTSPGYLVEDAVAFEDAAVAAVRARDLPGLEALADRARAAKAPTWPSLVAGTALALDAGIPTDGLSHVVARGVGHLVGAAAAERLDLPAGR